MLILIRFDDIQLLIIISSKVKVFIMWLLDVLLNLHERVLSSAKSVNLKTIEQLGKSFINIINNNEPRMEPWGTPRSIKQSSEFSPLRDTYCCLPVKYDWNQLRATPRTPYTPILSSNKLWSTQSNALLKSRNVATSGDDKVS